MTQEPRTTPTAEEKLATALKEVAALKEANEALKKEQADVTRGLEALERQLERPTGKLGRPFGRPLGRPLKRAPELGERVPLSLRVSTEIKSRLDAAADESGRSQSAEAEFRLERSFDHQDLLGEVLSLAYGPKLAGLLLALGLTMKRAAQMTLHLQGRPSAQDWTSNPDAYRQAAEAAAELLTLAMPQGRGTAVGVGSGRYQIELLVEALGSPNGQPTSLLDGEPMVEPGQVKSLRQLLGEVADRVIDAQPKHSEMRKTVEQALSAEGSQPSLSPRLRGLAHETDQLAREIILRINTRHKPRSEYDRELAILSLFNALWELHHNPLTDSDKTVSPDKLKETG